MQPEIRSKDFDDFARAAGPALRKALMGHLPFDAVDDAVAAAMLYAWREWDRVSLMERPVGYLFRVAQSSARRRLVPNLPPVVPARIPEVEPGLVPALLGLTPSQRTAVWLIEACGWSYAEVAVAMAVSESTVGTHRHRALENLRRVLGVDE